MNVAILTISSLSLLCSAGTLLIMVKTAKELKDAKTKVETDVAHVKAKTNTALASLRGALDGLEL